MFLRRKGRSWEIQAPAKLNLLFEVVARREDGYHDVETLMVPIGLCDTLVMTVDPTGGIELTCCSAAGSTIRADQMGDVPANDGNLVARAVRLLRDRSGIALGARIGLTKRIPSGAGLGGGSSDAAAALLLANRAWQLNWSRDQLHPVAAELGSDVPFFLDAGAAVCRGRGDEVERLLRVGPIDVVVVRPPVGLSTAKVYAACEPAATPKAVAPLLEALREGRLADAGNLLFNRLQTTSEQLSPWIGRLRDEFSRIDCLGHLMTGSGTGYFGLCRSRRHARRVASLLKSRELGMVVPTQSLVRTGSGC
ncbi:MAG: 4-(cytidine 5'-diphospho)-2-C-methyl-D-erythritol kinase [Pirellulales bacterium]